MLILNLFFFFAFALLTMCCALAIYFNPTHIATTIISAIFAALSLFATDGNGNSVYTIFRDIIKKEEELL